MVTLIAIQGHLWTAFQPPLGCSLAN